MSAIPSLKEVEKVVGIDAVRWKGRCHEVALAIIRQKLVTGKAVYGMFYGKIAGGSYFNPGEKTAKMLQRHGWIELADGRILDPTRWVFENKEPYLWVSSVPAVKCEEYDLGASRFNSHHAAPILDFHDAMTLVMNRETSVLLDSVMETPIVCRVLGRKQVDYIAHINPQKYKLETMKTLYSLVEQAGMRAYIPIDFWHYVMGADQPH